MTNAFTPTAINTATTIAITTGNTFLHTAVLPKSNTGTITFQSASGTTYWVYPPSSIGNTYIYDVELANGLTIVTASADYITVNTGQ